MDYRWINKRALSREIDDVNLPGNKRIFFRRGTVNAFGKGLAVSVSSKIDDFEGVMDASRLGKCFKLGQGEYIPIKVSKTVHFKPASIGYGPSCLIATSKSTYDHLLNIYARLPKLKITRIEYAIDLFCRDRKAAANLLWLIRRYLYAPHAVRTSMVGGEFFGYQN